MQVIAYRANGSTSNIERVYLRKDFGASAGTEMDPITGLDHDSSGLIISTIANNAATAVANSVGGSDEIETIATLGAYAAPTSSFTRFREVDSTNHPGLYEIQFADTVYSVSNSKYTDICITGVADLATFHGRIYLDTIQASDIDQVLQDYDSSSGVVSNTDLAARTIATATIPTKTDVDDVETNVKADALKNTQAICRGDATSASDNATKITAINTDEDTGVTGTYDPTSDSLEARADTVDDVNLIKIAGGSDLAASGTGGQGYGE